MKTNATKTKAMFGHNGSLRLQLSTPAYKRHLTGTGLPHRESKRHKVSCPHCDKEIQVASLARHIHSQHNSYQRPFKRRRLLEDARRAPQHFYTFSPSYRWPLSCPVPGCVGRALNRDALRMHFCHRHPFDFITIVPEGHLPKCLHCGLQVNATCLHLQSKRCQRGALWKRSESWKLANSWPSNQLRSRLPIRHSITWRPFSTLVGL